MSNISGLKVKRETYCQKTVKLLYLPDISAITNAQ